jgi:hypothetical protein
VRGRLIVHSKHLKRDVDVQEELRDLVATIKCNDRDTAVPDKYSIRNATKLKGVNRPQGADIRIRCLLLKRGGESNAVLGHVRGARAHWFNSA